MTNWLAENWEELYFLIGIAYFIASIFIAVNDYKNPSKEVEAVSSILSKKGTFVASLFVALIGSILWPVPATVDAYKFIKTRIDHVRGLHNDQEDTGRSS